MHISIKLTLVSHIEHFHTVVGYQIYKNLAANLQLAYILNDADEELHEGYDENGWRAALSFKYAF